MKNSVKNILRLLNPVINILNAMNGFKNFFKYPSFFIGYFKYKRLSHEVVDFKDLWPELNDRSSASQTGGGQYFYQDNWALNKVFSSKVTQHYDIGSRIDGFTSQCSVFTKVKFVDFRFVDYGIENMECIQGDILHLPFEDNSIDSLSCLHVIEHIGLGRYGDPIDPEGSLLAMKEIQRVLAINGNLYLGIPIGRERVMYHAHRILSTNTILTTLNELILLEFCAVDDKGSFVKSPTLDAFENSFYSLGLFHFKKIINE